MRERLTYANVVASLALFLALGGTSYAVIKLPRNSVGSREVRNGSLQVADLADAARGVRGVRGPQGPGGARGPSDVYTAHRTNIGLPATGRAAVDVVTLNVPEGSWWVIGSASVVNNPPGTADPFRCGVTFNGGAGDVAAVAVIGSAADPLSANELIVHEGRTLSGPTAIRLRCSHDSTIGGTPIVESAQLSAVRTENLQVQPG